MRIKRKHIPPILDDVIIRIIKKRRHHEDKEK